jgi:hypothetical protein
MNDNKYRFYFDKESSENIAEYYKYLIGETFSTTLGNSTIQVPIDKIISLHIEKDAYCLVLNKPYIF